MSTPRVLCLLACVLGPRLAFANVYVVDDGSEPGNLATSRTACQTSVPGCTLRAAIVEANAHAGPDTVQLSTNCVLSTTGNGEDGALTGDLDISDDLTLVGLGPGAVAVGATGGWDDRLFDVRGNVTVTMSDLSLSGGLVTGGSGGALQIGASGTPNVSLLRMSIALNMGQYGGGIYMSAGLLDVLDTSITDNTGSAGQGGGIYSGGTLSVRRSLIARNRVGNVNGPVNTAGAGLCLIGGDSHIVNTTVSDNYDCCNASNADPLCPNLNLGNNCSQSIGPGIFVGSGTGTQVFENITVVGNHCVGGVCFGGGVTLAGSQVWMKNSIVIDNAPGEGGLADCWQFMGSIKTYGNNALGLGCAPGLSAPGAVDLPFAGVSYTALRANGGPTQSRALLLDSTGLAASASPCTDTADALIADDQRGAGRRSGQVCDAGSVQARRFVVDAIDAADDASIGDGVCATNVASCTLRAAVSEANATGGADFIAFAATGPTEYDPGTATLAVTEDLSIGGRGASLTRVRHAAATQGVFAVTGGAPAVFQSLRISGGSSAGAGGAIEDAIDGGVFPAAFLRLTAVELDGNSAAGNGGAVHARVPATLTSVYAHDNGAGGCGGGIALEGNATLSASTVAHNTAVNGGGLCFLGNATSMRVENTTLANNTATGSGGGLYERITVTPNLIFRNDTIVANTSVSGGGGIDLDADSVFRLRSCIVAKNSNGTPVDCAGGSYDTGASGFNVIGNPCMTPTTGDSVGSVGTPLDPGLDVLAQNGGSVPTIALVAGSLAGDHGDAVSGAACLAVDARGDARPLGASCDAGAFESTQVSVGVSAMLPQPNVVPGQPVTLQIVASNGGPEGTSGAVLTLTDVFPPELQAVSWTCVASTGSTCQAPTGSGNISQHVALLSAGQATYMVNATVSASAFGTLSNTSQLVLTGGGLVDVDASNDSFLLTHAIKAISDLSVTLVDAPDPVVGGGQVSLSAVVNNAGPAPADNVTLSIVLPAGLGFVQATPQAGTCSNNGATIDCTLGSIAANAVSSVAVTAKAVAVGAFSTTATVASASSDPVPANDMVSESTLVQAAADLSVALTTSTGAIKLGGEATVTLAISNLGPSSAAGTAATVTLPPTVTVSNVVISAGTCTLGVNTVVCLLGDVAVGGTITGFITVKPVASGSHVLSASVTSGLPDPVAPNNVAGLVASTPLTTDLVTAISCDAATTDTNNDLPCTITVTNNSTNTDATSVSLTLSLPAPTSLIDTVIAVGACGVQGANLVCAVPVLRAGGSIVLHVVVSFAQAGTVTLQANALAAEDDVAPLDNTTSVNIVVAFGGGTGSAAGGSGDVGGVSVSTKNTKRGGCAQAPPEGLGLLSWLVGAVLVLRFLLRRRRSTPTNALPWRR